MTNVFNVLGRILTRCARSACVRSEPGGIQWTAGPGRKAVQQVFQDYLVPLSSTKHKTGHCLGAAGAIEAMICTQVLYDQVWLPLHQQGVLDAEMDEQNFVEDARLTTKVNYVMSNSFAFGGSNISLIFGTTLP